MFRLLSPIFLDGLRICIKNMRGGARLVLVPLNVEQAKQEMVLALYEQKRISFGGACHRLKINGWEFLELLKAQHAYLNVDLEDLLDASPLPA